MPKTPKSNLPPQMQTGKKTPNHIIKPESILPHARDIRRMGGFDEQGLADWFTDIYTEIAKLLTDNSKMLAEGGSIGFDVPQEASRRHELWMRYSHKVSQALTAKGYVVEFASSSTFGVVNHYVLSISLEE